jgi:hypothetical protein
VSPIAAIPAVRPRPVQLKLQLRLQQGLILAAAICLFSGPAWAGDLDADGISDAADNCASVANAGQQDTDLDGAGNACDFDYDNNGQVDDADADLLRAAFGTGPGDPGHSDAFDADDDGVIAGSDWAAFARAMGGQ